MNTANQQQPKPPRTDGPATKPPAGDPPRPSPAEDEIGNVRPNREIEDRQEDVIKEEKDARTRDSIAISQNRSISAPALRTAHNPRDDQRSNRPIG